MKRLRSWLKENPSSCYSKLFLLEAEMAALKGDFQEARDKYMCALAMSKPENLLPELSVQGERAGLCMYDSGELSSAKEFFRESHNVATTRGAIAHADYL